MADGTAGPPPDELGRPSKDIAANANKGPEQKNFGAGIPSSRPQEFGRIDLTTTPYGADVKALQSQYFPEGRHLKIANGSEYILDPTGKTIILFEKPTSEGFTSAYSPLTPRQLREQVNRLPAEQQQQLAQLLHLPESQVQSAVARAGEGAKINDLLRFLKTQGVFPRPDSRPAERLATTPRRDLFPSDLPEDHFERLTDEGAQLRKAEQWEGVRDLPEDDLRKVLYYRRFPEEFRSAPISPELRRQLRGTLRYYGVDASRMSEIPPVEPYRPSLEIPEGRKIGFVIGYHHLEKPWGHIFMEMMKGQSQFRQDQVEFIVIKNRQIPTGDPSPVSDGEIREAVASRGITDVIDIHEQLSTLNHYMDYDSAADFKGSFTQGDRKNPGGGEYTLDPTVPLWAVEQYYEGNTYPQLQHAVNEQIKKAEILIKSIKAK